MTDFDPEFESKVVVHLQTLDEWRSGLRNEPAQQVSEEPQSADVRGILCKWFPELADEPRIAQAAEELQKVFGEVLADAVRDALGG